MIKMQTAVLFFLASTCWAGPTITLMGGAAFPVSNFKVDGGGEDKIGSSGGAFGAQVMAPINDIFSVGGDILASDFGKKTSDVLYAPSLSTTYHEKPVTILAMARVGLPKEKPIRPFGFAGIGLHRSTLTADLTPEPGFAWVDTGTRETRNAIDDTATGFAAAFGAGVDFSLPSNFNFGLELRDEVLANDDFAIRSFSSAASTTGNITGTASAILILARGSYSF